MVGSPAQIVLALEILDGAAGKLTDQLGLPSTPRRARRGDGVGFGQCGEELHGAHRTDRIGDEHHRAFVIEVSARRNVGEQQMMFDQRLECPNILGRVPHAGAMALTRPMPTWLWSPG